MISLLFLLAFQTLDGEPHARARIGINVNEVREWTSDVSFANVALQAGPWRQLADPALFATVDERGLPTEPAKSIVFTGDYPYRKGFYELEGAGLALGGSGVVQSVDGGRFWLLDGFGSVSLIAAEPPIGDHALWDVRSRGETFNPRFIELLRELGPDTIRTLNWSRIRFVGAHGRQGWTPDWSQRPGPDALRQNADQGVALELHRALWEAVGSNGWINIPHLADEEYVRGMARVFEGFAGRLYVEFSNEAWNPGFPVFDWVETNRGTLTRGQFVGLAARQAFEWWSDEVDTVDVRFVVMGNRGDAAFAADQMTVVDELAGGLGCAAYFRAESGIVDPELLVDSARANLAGRTRDGLVAHAALAESWGVPFLGYEGGPNLFGAAGVAADSLPSLGAACSELFWTASEADMSLLCIYAGFRNPSTLGSYGWRHNLYVTIPKWEAAVSWNNGSVLLTPRLAQPVRRP